jgi:hypothetical protein
MIEKRLETPVLGYDHIPDLTCYIDAQREETHGHSIARCLLRRLRDHAP